MRLTSATASCGVAESQLRRRNCGEAGMEVLTPQLRRRSCGETWMELLIANPLITAVAEEFVP